MILIINDLKFLSILVLPNRYINTENKLMVARGKEGGGMGKINEGNGRERLPVME